MAETSKSNKMWGGRFSSKPDELMEKINSSISFDKRLFEHDIKGSIAHLKMLEAQGIIDEKAARRLEDGLEKQGLINQLAPVADQLLNERLWSRNNI